MTWIQPRLLAVILILCYWVIGAHRFALYNVENKSEKNVALTFDDGPHGTLTPILLDALKQRNAHATFYIMGVKVQYHADILKRMIAEGHEIGNHVWNHPVLSKMSLENVHIQVTQTSQAIFNATNYTPRTMRPPYGNTNGGLNKYLESTEGLTVVLWSLDTMDWKRPKPMEIVNTVVNKIKPGGIILCHDVHPGTIEAIPILVDELQKKGFNFLTVSEMQQHAKMIP